MSLRAEKLMFNFVISIYILFVAFSTRQISKPRRDKIFRTVNNICSENIRIYSFRGKEETSILDKCVHRYGSSRQRAQPTEMSRDAPAAGPIGSKGCSPQSNPGSLRTHTSHPEESEVRGDAGGRLSDEHEVGIATSGKIIGQWEAP